MVAPIGWLPPAFAFFGVDRRARATGLDLAAVLAVAAVARDFRPAATRLPVFGRAMLMKPLVP